MQSGRHRISARESYAPCTEHSPRVVEALESNQRKGQVVEAVGYSWIVSGEDP